MTTSRVIVLDDDPDLRQTFAEVIPLLGASVEIVASVPELEAVVTHESHPFDLAIIDINLGPDVPSGIDAYRWLRSHQFTGRIVFLTGHARQHPLVSEAKRIGDVSVHDKPISFAELRTIIR
jgi:CheY-like chemotaxis protein